MKRLSVAAAVLALLTLALPAAAPAAGNHHAATRIAGPVARPPAAARQTLAGPRFLPLPRALTGGATVLVHVYDYTGNPEVGAQATWWVTTGTEQASGGGSADGSGLVTFTGVPAAVAGNGEIIVYPVSEDAYYDLWNLSWPDPAGTDMGVQPGRVSLELVAGGDWSDYGKAWFDIYSTNGDAYQDAGSWVQQSGSVTSAAPLALGGTLSMGAVNFRDDEGAEFSLTGLSSSPGATTASGLSIDQAAAQRIFIRNYWASGKPGSTTKLWFNGFPAGWVNALSGYSEAGGAQPVTFWSDWASPGPGWVGRTLTIPKTAKPGFRYNFYAEHTVGPLRLREPYQVCTFTPSRAVVGRTGGVRFSGRVPFAAGHTKRLLIYRRTTSAGQPAVKGGFTSWKGWQKVSACTSDGSGRYTTKAFTPGRTSWYVLWYPGDAYNWRAWTSVAKVTVR